MIHSIKYEIQILSNKVDKLQVEMHQHFKQLGGSSVSINTDTLWQRLDDSFLEVRSTINRLGYAIDRLRMSHIAYFSSITHMLSHLNEKVVEQLAHAAPVVSPISSLAIAVSNKLLFWTSLHHISQPIPSQLGLSASISTYHRSSRQPPPTTGPLIGLGVRLLILLFLEQALQLPQGSPLMLKVRYLGSLSCVLGCYLCIIFYILGLYCMLILLYWGVPSGLHHFLNEVHLFMIQNLFLCYE